MKTKCLARGIRRRALIVSGVTIHLRVLGLVPEFWRPQHRSAVHIEAIQVWVLRVLVVEGVEYQVSQLAQVLMTHRNVEIMVVVGNKSSRKVGRGVQA
jgi:hypothetical protein